MQQSSELCVSWDLTGMAPRGDAVLIAFLALKCSPAGRRSLLSCAWLEILPRRQGEHPAPNNQSDGPVVR